MQFLNTYSIFLLSVSFILGCFSVCLFLFERTKIALIILMVTSFVLGILFATIDPFLHLWDEQFHALVSKNLIDHWLKPTLYDNPILKYNYSYWSGNHIWLHKQPLFLWQMALSQYIFGNTELGLRFPDVIMHTVLTFIVFDIGRLIKNERVGFLAALFFTFLNFTLDLISGRVGLDHNDFAFMFYITLSFWAYFKYREEQRFFWTFVIGLSVGCAILVKWLPGLLIYLCWILVHVFESGSIKNALKSSKPILVSLLITFVVFMPWQIYCYLNFPNEFKYEMIYNSLHLSSVVEEHSGSWTFYFKELGKLYGDGDVVPYIILAALLFFIYDKKLTAHNKIVITTAIVFIYIFFTLVQTKMIGFPVIVLPLVVIVLANFIVEAIGLVKNILISKIVFFGCGVLITFLFFDLNLVLKAHTLGYRPNDNQNRLETIMQTEKIRKINSIVNNKNIVLFNCGDLYIKTMYYLKNVTAYGNMPSANEYRTVKNKGYKIAVLKIGTIPDYIKNDKDVLKIDF